MMIIIKTIDGQKWEVKTDMSTNDVVKKCSEVASINFVHDEKLKFVFTDKIVSIEPKYKDKKGVL